MHPLQAFALGFLLAVILLVFLEGLIGENY